ncbi:hypothetical protein VTN00DRAFT_3859 [Thermoascus crustaceus]|uniref:uncharacterized protein n=1 Tax=Thermoascus crustaceus TaxID=5088 RepID=UPI0037421241
MSRSPVEDSQWSPLSRTRERSTVDDGQRSTGQEHAEDLTAGQSPSRFDLHLTPMQVGSEPAVLCRRRNKQRTARHPGNRLGAPASCGLCGADSCTARAASFDLATAQPKDQLFFSPLTSRTTAPAAPGNGSHDHEGTFTVFGCSGRL